MSPDELNKYRTLAKTKKRQQNFRMRQKEKGLVLLQARLSYFAHDKLSLLADLNGINKEKVYELAIEAANIDKLPKPHREVLEGHLIGTRTISAWVKPEILAKLISIVPSYRNKTVALSAIINHYCDNA